MMDTLATNLHSTDSTGVLEGWFVGHDLVPFHQLGYLLKRLTGIQSYSSWDLLNLFQSYSSWDLLNHLSLTNTLWERMGFYEISLVASWFPVDSGSKAWDGHFFVAVDTSSDDGDIELTWTYHQRCGFYQQKNRNDGEIYWEYIWMNDQTWYNMIKHDKTISSLYVTMSL